MWILLKVGLQILKNKVLKIFSEILFFFVLPIKRRVFRWSKNRVVVVLFVE